MYAHVAKYFIGRDSSEKLLNYNPKISCILIITKHVKLVSLIRNVQGIRGMGLSECTDRYIVQFVDYTSASVLILAIGQLF